MQELDLVQTDIILGGHSADSVDFNALLTGMYTQIPTSLALRERVEISARIRKFLQMLYKALFSQRSQ